LKQKTSVSRYPNPCRPATLLFPYFFIVILREGGPASRRWRIQSSSD